MIVPCVIFILMGFI